MGDNNLQLSPLLKHMLTYCIENTKNGKCYIGQTTQKLSRRKQAHLSHLKSNIHSNKHLQEDWNKHKRNDFRFFVLEDGLKTIKELNNEEVNWIDGLDTTNRNNGYNIDSGGKNTDPRNCISKCYKQPVVQYNLDGTFVKKFDTIKEAVDEFNGSTQNIISCLNGDTNTAYDFQWKRYYGHLKQTILPMKSCIDQKKNKGDSKITMQYSISGELLGIYPSATEASRQTGTNDVSIRCVCSGKYKTDGGCQWRYKDSEREVKDLGNYKPPNNTPSPVIKLNEMGFVLGEWKTLTDASKWAGRSRPYISKQCKDTKNYKWNFAKAI